MRFVSLPNLVISAISRSAIAMAQLRLSEAQQEASTGRLHDVGLMLGSRTGSALSLRLRLEELVQGSDLNKQAGIKAGLVQSTLDSVSALAANMLATLTGARGAAGGQELAADASRSAMQSLADLMNTTFDGQFVFGGVNSDMPPLVDYQSGGPQAAIDAAFVAHFGFPQGSPATSQISRADMNDFLETSFGDLFTPPQWNAVWSRASDTPVLHRLGNHGFVGISSSANAPYVTKLAQAFSMMTALGQGQLSDSAFGATADRAIALVAEAQLDIGSEQARIGISQQRIEASSLHQERSADAAKRAINALETVDPYEAAARVNLLMTQLETSYAVSSRINRLSLLNYI